MLAQTHHEARLIKLPPMPKRASGWQTITGLKGGGVHKELCASFNIRRPRLSGLGGLCKSAAALDAPSTTGFRVLGLYFARSRLL